MAWIGASDGEAKKTVGRGKFSSGYHGNVTCHIRIKILGETQLKNAHLDILPWLPYITSVHASNQVGDPESLDVPTGKALTGRSELMGINGYTVQYCTVLYLCCVSNP